MHEHEQDDPEVLSEIEKLGYDPRDVPVEKTKTHAIALFVSCFVVMILAGIVMTVIDRMQGSKTVFEQPLPVRQTLPEAPYPLLQTNSTAKTDIHDERAIEAVKTDTAGWVDKGKGVARIPVEQAKALILGEGMPRSAVQGAPSSVTGEDPSKPGTAAPSATIRAGGGS